MKKLIVILLCITMLLASCVVEEKTGSVVENSSSENQESADSVEDSSANSTEKATETETEEDSEPERTEFYTNELVEIGDLVVSLNEVFESEGKEFFEPDEGNKYVIVDLTFYNTGSESYALSSMLGFELVDNETYTYDTSWTAPLKGSLDGTILPGRQLRGQVGFEIPEGSVATELLFDYDLFASGQLVFKLDPELAVEATTFENPVEFKDVISVGTPIETDNYTFLVNSFSQSEGSQYFGPEEGYVYYVLDVSITNKSAESQVISTMLMFEMQDQLGYEYGIAMYTDAKGSVDGDLAAGRTARGEIAFEVPKDLELYHLIYTPEVFDGGQYVIEIK